MEHGRLTMKKTATIIIVLLLLGKLINAQSIREFSRDTGLFVSELLTFTGAHLESEEIIDFKRFLNVFDSLSYEQQLEIIDVSNLLLKRKCRPRPHFINYQRIMMEFFTEGKTSHGYDLWLEGTSRLLRSPDVSIREIDQWLSLSFSLLDENIVFDSNTITWRVATPSFQFYLDEKIRVRFEDVTLACYSGRDFIQIRDATGYIDPFELHWYGTHGMVSWERVGMPDNEMNAVLGDFQINLRTPGYTADSAKLYYPALFEGIALGKLEDKVTLIKDLTSIVYPKFTSYKSSYRIDDFVPGINYRGGLSIEGSNLVGSSVGKEPAMLEIYASDTLRLRFTSDRVSMNGRFIRAPHSSVSIFFGEDSIFHPDLELTFDVARDQLRLNKSEDFKSLGPYSNSYHKLDMNFDELSWNRGESLIKFQALQGTSVGRATFESNTFFDYGFYTGLQAMDLEHPLAQLYTYSRMLGGETFALPNYAGYIGYPEYQVRHLLMSLTKDGFVYYDDQSNLITVRQKTFDYISASMKQRDYDVIRFLSRTEGTSNAQLDLFTRDLTISGVPVIFLSDSQNVRLIPTENRIVMKRNRSFQFDGLVDAGLFQISGKNFFFDYENFKIDMQRIDSLKISIYTDEVNQYGEPILARIENAMEEMTGQLLIDDPRNKSGLANYPQYPTFTSLEGSYIYFDDMSIQNGVYHREDFYFRMEPFTIDSLDNFSPEAIAPKGTFISAGILPPIDLEMTLRDDNSLGFYMQTPEEGIEIYGGVAKLYSDLEMSSGGLRGYGTMDYLSSTTESDLFMMHPDSMMARSRHFLLREHQEATEYPYVENREADLKLFPEENLLEISRVEEVFKVFKDSVFHGGDLALSPSGLTGNGVIGFPDARLESDLFRYSSRTIRADSCGVKLTAGSFDEFPFLTNDVQVFVDLDQRKGEFMANGDATLIELPYNLYQTRLDKMTWYMDEDQVAMSQEKLLPENHVDIGIDSLITDGPTYTSTHPLQDSLNFVSPQAVYNYRSRLLHASGVPFIEVGDAYVFPHEKELDVGYRATMSQLENARILASKNMRQYQIYNASVAVNGAKDYKASGYYDYLDAFGNAYQVYFDKIWVDTSILTLATGTVAEDAPFMLSPYFDFQGEVQLSVDTLFLSFDGGVRLVHECDLGKSWLRFNAAIDPANIRIPVPAQMQNTDLNKIFSGTMITRDSTHIYSTFLSGRKDYFDASISSAYGELIYDPDREDYVISTPEKLADQSWPGQYLRLETESCQVYGEGPVNLNLEFGQVKMVSTGNTTHRISEGEFGARLVLGMDFPFSTEALRVMGAEIDSLPQLDPVDLTDPFYQLAMKDLLGRDLASELEKQMGLYGAYEEIPPRWKHTIFFSDLPLTWNQDSHSFRYKGMVGIGNIGDIQVNKKLEAYVELVERGSGDLFDIYLRADDNTWYYIAYSPGGLQVLSSNRSFNQIVFDLKAGDRRVKGKVGQAPYVYSLAARRRLDLFIDRFLSFEE
ncbi:MAG: hypothetical protein P1P86_09545 [Bacteroidales bacterium]|nr:hypothetical protein [Bacteroidales bacterium]